MRQCVIAYSITLKDVLEPLAGPRVTTRDTNETAVCLTKQFDIGVGGVLSIGVVAVVVE